jgi:hypothetical protein
MFLTSAGSEEVEAIHRMMSEEKAHASAIAELMLELGQAPRPAPPDVHAGDLHYLEVHYLLPILTRAKEALVAAHASARTRLAGSPRALELVTRLEGAQRRHLDSLRAFQAAAPAATPA